MTKYDVKGGRAKNCHFQGDFIKVRSLIQSSNVYAKTEGGGLVAGCLHIQRVDIIIIQEDIVIGSLSCKDSKAIIFSSKAVEAFSQNCLLCILKSFSR